MDPPEPALGPRPNSELAAVLAELGDPSPTLPVRCQNFERCDGKRITKWSYDPEQQSIVPLHRETKAWTQGAQPWLDRANDRKGPIRTARGPGAKHDGLGTQNHTCPRCKREIAVSAERRFRLYLTALTKGRREVFI